MRYPAFVLAVGLAAICVDGVRAQTPETPIFRMERLSERVLLLTEISPMENIIVALATEKGLVVVDATGSPVTATSLRESIEREFGRDDFAYVIQTHYHWDHAWGNVAFPGAVIIAQEGSRDLISRDRSRLADIVSNRRESLQDMEARLAGLDPNTAERANLQLRRDFSDRNLRGIEGGFDIRGADITFTDRLSLDLGDLTLELSFFGRAHSGNDILIQIPEEELLLTGDLFLDIGWLPLFAGQQVLDIPRWIEVLGQVLDGEAHVARVVPGHRETWSREKFDLWRGYIVDLWAGVNEASEEGATLEEVLARFPLGERFGYLKALGHTDEALDRFQRGNVEAFWRQLSHAPSQGSPVLSSHGLSSVSMSSRTSSGRSSAMFSSW
jgi:glyoxylase-like metal-dependent hydrolase (beta-lactamase superfamily II)